tara:strand:+ start:5094 stop:6548 length:1455 start_codon:yes stop_codon:yes gene_type:complete
MQRSKTFCIKPWMHIATYTSGEAMMCCVARKTAGNLNRDTLEDIWNSDHYKQARLDMLAGRENAACGKCYSEERAGINSHRVVENHIWEIGTPSAIQPSVGKEFIDQLVAKTQSDGYLDTKPITFDFRLGNTCNLKCVMCGPKDSSQWVRFSQEMNEVPGTSTTNKSIRDIYKGFKEKFSWVENQSFWDDQFLPLLSNVKHMIIAGGEPLLLEQHTRLLERCIAEGYSKNITIRYHTNGTVMSPKILKLWEHFKAIDICISMDSWGNKNNYIRYPGHWNDILDNIEKLEDSADNIIPRIISTVNAYNVFYMPDFADWLLEQNYKKLCRHNSSGNGVFTIAYVHGPSHLNCKVFPQKIKDKITKKYEDWFESMERDISIYATKHSEWGESRAARFDEGSTKEFSFGDNLPDQVKPGIIDIRSPFNRRRAAAKDKLDNVFCIKDFMNSEDMSKHWEHTLQYTKKLDEVRGTNFKDTFPELSKLIDE